MANGKLTLRLDDRLIDQAKDLAARRGVSVDRLIGEILEAISGANGSPASGDTHMGREPNRLEDEGREFQARLKYNINGSEQSSNG